MSDPHESTRHRLGDHGTSVEGARAVTKRAPNQRMRLLTAFSYSEGLTDEEAAQACGLLQSCYWKRCGELREDGLIEYTDEVRKGSAGVERRVSKITTNGLRRALEVRRTYGS